MLNWYINCDSAVWQRDYTLFTKLFGVTTTHTNLAEINSIDYINLGKDEDLLTKFFRNSLLLKCFLKGECIRSDYLQMIAKYLSMEVIDTGSRNTTKSWIEITHATYLETKWGEHNFKLYGTDITGSTVYSAI